MGGREQTEKLNLQEESDGRDGHGRSSERQRGTKSREMTGGGKNRIVLREGFETNSKCSWTSRRGGTFAYGRGRTTGERK